MEISSTNFNSAAAQQPRTRSGSENTVEQKPDEKTTSVVASDPENRAFEEAEKVEASQSAQEKSTVENREQEDKRQGRSIDVTV